MANEDEVPCEVRSLGTVSDANPVKYSAPKIRLLGSMSELTQSGGPPSTSDGGGFAVVS